MTYVIVGDDFLVQKEIEKQIVNNKFTEEERFLYDFEEISLFSLLEKVNTISFLSPRKVVILKNAFFLGGESKRKIEEEELASFLTYLDHQAEDVLLFLTVSKLDERKRKLLQEIRKKTTVLSLQYDGRREIQERMQGYTIEEGAVQALLEAVKGEENRLPLECEKLKLYALASKKIGRKDVEELVSFSLPDQEETIFSFSNHLAQKDKRGAYQDYLLLSKMGVDALSLMGLLESQYRALYQVKILVDDGYKKEEIANRLSMHPFRVQKLQAVEKLYSKKEVQSILSFLAELDEQFKSGKIDGDFLIDSLILRV